jgi:hypothetical protein
VDLPATAGHKSFEGVGFVRGGGCVMHIFSMGWFVDVLVELPASAVFRKAEVREIAFDVILKAATWAFDECFPTLHACSSVFLVWRLVAGNRRFAALWTFDVVLVLGHGWFVSDSLR